MEPTVQAAVRWQVMFLERFGEPREHFWLLSEICTACREEHPEWDETTLHKRARAIFDYQLHEIQTRYNSQRRLHRHVNLSGLAVDMFDLLDNDQA